jgi:2-oxo-hept-3-ene-1,7-dioate hydratase
MATADQLRLGMAGQLARLEGAVRGGMPRAGWKVGLNFPEVRQAIGISEVVVAWIDGGRVLRSGASMAVPVDARLHVEAEICLRVAHAIAADAGPDVAWQGIDMMAPALEVVDYARSSANLAAMVTHCLFHEATVLGAQTGARAHAELGVRWPEVTLNGAPVGAPRGDTVPTELGEVVAIVARLLGENGQKLEAGDLLLCGSYTNPVAVGAGDVVAADFGALGAVELRVTA